jgi:hypothetical protein
MITSNQIAGVVGGQQVMFANQAAFAHQISGQMGFMPSGPTGQQMQSTPAGAMPSYGYGWGDSTQAGTQIAGGMANMIPAAATGISIAGGMMGGAAGWADPFTGTARAFAGGAGFRGAGFMETMGGVGRAFAGGGLRAGMGAVASGALAATGVGLGYYAAGKAVGAVAEGIYGGAQNVQDVGRMAGQYMTPDFAQAGQTVTGGPSRSAIKGITSFLHELASEDVMSSMKDMRKLMDQAGQMGMLGGVGDLQSFKQRFRQLIDQSKNIAQVLGTSVEEAMPLMGQMRQMGLWSAQDVMGTAVAMKSAGPQGAQQMMGAMQTGAMISRQAGGRMQAGARLGREMFENVQASTRVGTLSEQQIMEYTGGTGGAEGQRQVAQGLQQAMVNMAQHPIGQLLIAGLGETQGNKFTGRMDPEKLNKFLSGELSADDLQKMGRGQVSNKARAASFMNRRQEMGQELIAQGGLEAGNRMMQTVIDKAMGEGALGQEPEVISQFIQKLSGSDQRTADMLQQQFQDIGRTRMERRRQMEATLESSMRNLEYRKTRSWAGLKDALSHKWEEEIEKPLNRVGEELSTNIGDAVEGVTDKLLGRVRPSAPMSMKGMYNALGQRGKGGGGYGMTEGQAMQGWMDRAPMENYLTAGNLGVAAAGVGGAILTGGASLALAGKMIGDVKPRAELLTSMGLATRSGAAGARDVGLGGGKVANVDEVRYLSESITRAALSPAGLIEENPAKRRAIETAKTHLNKMMSDPAMYDELKKLKEEDPKGYAVKFAERLKARVGASTWDTLTKGMGGSEAGNTVKIVAQLQHEAGWAGDELAANYKKAADDLGGVPTSNEARDLLMRDIAETVRSPEGTVGTLALGAALAPFTFGASLLWAGKKTIEGPISGEELQRLSSEYGSDISAALTGNRDAQSRLLAARAGDKTGALTKFYDYFIAKSGGGSADTAMKTKLASQISRLGAGDAAAMDKKIGENLRDIASQQGKVTEVGSKAATSIEELRKIYARGDVAGGRAKEAEIARELTDKEVESLAKQGPMGQQLARQHEIQTIGEMTKEQFYKKMKVGGIDLIGAAPQEVQESVAAAWGRHRGGKLTGKDLADVTESARRMGEAAKALGPGGGKSATAAGMDRFFADYNSNKPIRVTFFDQSDQKPSNTLQKDVAGGQDVSPPTAAPEK